MSNDKFEWTDELVKEFFKKNFGCGRLDADIEQFKQEQLSKRDWEIVRIELFSGRVVDVKADEFTQMSDLFKKDKIHSVRRLSDGEIFVLGDDITWNKGINHGRIERFEISKNNGNMLAVHFSGGVGINNISKRKIKPIFITEDGVEIFTDGNYWILEDDWSIVKWELCCKEGMKNSYKYFSTKEKAEEYIAWNKSHFSLAEIMANSHHVSKHTYSFDADKLKQLAKSKMDGKK